MLELLHAEFYFIKLPKAGGFCGRLTDASIDGVGKMPLQASIFPPGRIVIENVHEC